MRKSEAKKLNEIKDLINKWYKLAEDNRGSITIDKFSLAMLSEKIEKVNVK